VQTRFSSFTLDHNTRQLMRGTRTVHLSPKAFELLVMLIGDRPRVLSKAELQQRLWPRTFVAEANLSNLVGEIRQALGDRGRMPKWIRTAHGYGYAFSGSATTLPGGMLERDGPVCWLEWGRKRFPLARGEHVIGRDPGVDIRLDLSTVSRRHARVVVSDQGAILEDVGSKNGTRRGAERVTTPIQLKHGDQIHLGSLVLLFHVRAVEGTTETQTTVVT
jgi:DNA-binding winged helix-turn-helix (wHTH) protein